MNLLKIVATMATFASLVFFNLERLVGPPRFAEAERVATAIAEATWVGIIAATIAAACALASMAPKR